MTDKLKVKRTPKFSFGVLDSIALLNFAVVASLLLAVFVTNYLGGQVSNFISAAFLDKPSLGVAYDFTGKNMSGHYFGDFLQTIDWANRSNPWTMKIANYPPLPVYLLKLISWMPYDTARAIYLVTLVAVSAAVVFFISKGLAFSTRLTLAAVLGLASTPILASVDRGNNVAVVGAMFGLFAWATIRDKRKLAIAMLVLMVSFKVYPVIFSIMFIRKRWFKELLIAGAATLVITLGLFAFTPGGFAATFGAFMQTNQNGASSLIYHLMNDWRLALKSLGFSDAAASGYSHDTLSAVAKVLPFFAGISALAALGLSKLRDLERLYLLGLSMVFIYVAPLAYNWTWAVFLLVLVIADLREREIQLVGEASVWKANPMAAFIVLTLGVLAVPVGWHIAGTKIGLMPYLGLLFGAVGVVVAFVTNGRRATATTAASEPTEP